MRKNLWIGLVAIVAVLFLTAGFSLAIDGEGGGPGNDEVAPVQPDPGGDCNCPAIYDPVVCKVGNEKKKFSNSCVAGCAGATSCESAPDKI